MAVLGYHKIGDPPEDWWSWQYVPADVLSRQIELLRADGWDPISAADLVRALDDASAIPARSFLVTFDDAYMSLRADAVDCLRELGVPGVVFTPTGFVGGSNSFDDGTEPRERICDWETLRELEVAGISVQSHGVSHRAFSTLSDDERRTEGTASRQLLEEHVGGPVELFAYPYGDTGEDPADALRAAGYRAAFTYGGGAFDLPAADPFRLPRLAMGPDTDVLAELGL